MGGEQSSGACQDTEPRNGRKQDKACLAKRGSEGLKTGAGNGETGNGEGRKSARSLRIFVRRADGRTTALCMSPDDKVERLEQSLGHAREGEDEQRRLVVDGRRLIREETLRDSGVMDQATVWELGRLDGGAKSKGNQTPREDEGAGGIKRIKAGIAEVAQVPVPGEGSAAAAVTVEDSLDASLGALSLQESTQESQAGAPSDALQAPGAEARRPEAPTAAQLQGGGGNASSSARGAKKRRGKRGVMAVEALE